MKANLRASSNPSRFATLPQKRLWPSVVIVSALVMQFAFGSILRDGEGLIAIGDDADRILVAEAVGSLAYARNDLNALEVVLSHFRPEIVDSIGTNVQYAFFDPYKRIVYQAVANAMYPFEFLERALACDRGIVAYWALRQIEHQLRNRDHPEVIAADGVVGIARLNRLCPTLERLWDSPYPRLRDGVRRFIVSQGLLVEREKILTDLRHADDAVVEPVIRRVVDEVKVNPGIASEIWQVLLRARDEQLIVTILRYRWLFDLAEVSDEKRQFIEKLLNEAEGGVLTNLNSSLEQLAISKNPLALEILGPLASSRKSKAKERAAHYIQLYRQANAKTEEYGNRTAPN